VGRLRWIAVATAVMVWGGAPLYGQDSSLDTLRADVRVGSPDESSHSPAPRSEHYSHEPCGDDLDPDAGLFALAFYGAAVVATSPISVPLILLDDDLVPWGGFARFPYDQTPGYILGSDPNLTPRTWAGRFDVQWVESFDDLDQIGGHLLLETATRFGLDMRARHLEERLSRGGTDQLWLGDCNLTYSFAQSNRAQFRAGLGLNWMTDDTATDVGFNFVYGADFFPRKPWVLSATLDAGTLGHAGLFRFQTTAGLLLQRFEVYTGYEYTNIDHTHWNALLGGVRLWF